MQNFTDRRTKIGFLAVSEMYARASDEELFVGKFLSRTFPSEMRFSIMWTTY